VIRVENVAVFPEMSPFGFRPPPHAGLRFTFFGERAMLSLPAIVSILPVHAASAANPGGHFFVK
jgi:hypothetical protein